MQFHQFKSAINRLKFFLFIAHSIADVRQQIYHLPKVHEAEQTYTVPAKQSLIKPIIGGGEPIHPTMVPQPQYIYIPSPPQAHHPYISQAP